MTDNNIWKAINFDDAEIKSAYDYLVEQSSFLVEATKGELKMEVEAVDAFYEKQEHSTPVIAALYILYVKSPKLGGFRRKILTVVEGKESGRFPVDVVSHIESKTYPDVTEENFLAKIEEILSITAVKKTIENLYKESKEYESGH